ATTARRSTRAHPLRSHHPAGRPPPDPPIEVAAPAGEPAEQPGSPQPAEGTPTDKSADSAAAIGSVGSLAFAATDADASPRAARLYFSIDPMGQKLGAIEPWAPGEEPRFEAADIAASNNANVKLATLPPGPWPAGKPGSLFDAP